MVDDASTDATGRLADELAATDPHVRVVHHPVNRKLGGSHQERPRGRQGRRRALHRRRPAVRDDRARPGHPRAADLRGRHRQRVPARPHRRGAPARGLLLDLQRADPGDVRHPAARHQLRLQAVPAPRAGPRRPWRSEGSFIDAELVIRAQRSGFHIVQIGVDYFPRTRGVSTLSSLGGHPDDAAGDDACCASDLRSVTPVVPVPVTRPARRHRGRPRADRRASTGPCGPRTPDGVVTATSLLAVGRAFDGAVAMLHDTPSLDVGRAPGARRGGPAAAVGARRSRRWSTRAARSRSRTAPSSRAAPPGASTPTTSARELGAQVERVVGAGLRAHAPGHPPAHAPVAAGRPGRGRAGRPVRRAGGAAARRAGSADRSAPASGCSPRRLAGRLDAAGIGHTAAYAGLDESGSLGLGALEPGARRRRGRRGADPRDQRPPRGRRRPGRRPVRWGFHWAWRARRPDQPPRARAGPSGTATGSASVRELAEVVR